MFLNVLIPLEKTEKNPVSVKGSCDGKNVNVDIVWSQSNKEKIVLDLSWDQKMVKGPITIVK